MSWHCTVCDLVLARLNLQGWLTDCRRVIGNTYDTEFEVYADGYKFKLVDPYGTPKLYIRRPGNEQEGTRLFRVVIVRELISILEVHTFVGVSVP